MVRSIPRWLARAPIPLFRAGLGGAFAGVLVMLEHRGRPSGLDRALGIPGLRAGDPLPADIGERVPLVRIATVPR